MAKRLITSIVAAGALLWAGSVWSAAPFVDNGDGTVTDTSTGLMWDQCALGQIQEVNACTGAGTAYNWANAQTQVITLQTASTYKTYSDWRSPNFVELQTLIKTGSTPQIDATAFPNSPNFMWSSFTSSSAPESALVVIFNGGLTAGNLKTNANGYVRMVRGGQCPSSFALLPVGVSTVGATTATLTATSVVAATGYWMVLPRGAATPTASQIKTPASYSAATVVASGNGAMTARTAKTFGISGLTLGTAYDVYLVAQTPLYTLMSCMAAAPFNTQAVHTSAIVIDPATPARVYAALDGSGVYHSVNSGANWTAATTQPGNLNIRALVIKPGSPSTLFAASYGGGVFKSTDSAATWSACATQPANQNLLSLAIDTAGRLYAGSELGVAVSSNDCAGWSAMNTGLPP